MNYSDDVIANFESYSIAQQFKIIITEVKWLISLTSEKVCWKNLNNKLLIGIQENLLCSGC